ncbi:MAG: CotH kinase family protein [Prevotella sp.]|nr:CotH kinase family protein [Prevotella sp.]
MSKIPTRTLLIVFTLLFLLFVPTKMAAQQRDNYRSLLRNPNVKVETTNLPIVFITVGGKTILRDNYILARMKIIHNGEGLSNHADTLAYPDQHVDYEGWISLKYRGNSSFSSADKKPLAFRTLETNVLPDYGGLKKKVEILGMPKDNKWGFIAPWSDETMFRDVLSFELGRPWFDWVPRAQMCEVILDGTYYGVFVLCERVSKGKHRLDLNEPGSEEGDLTGDYHVTVDHGYDPYFTSRHRPWQSLDGSIIAQNFLIKYEYADPDDEEFSDLPIGTRVALHNEINKMEDSFLSNDWNSADGGYRACIDVQSFIDYMLATEVSMNIDGYRLSTHLYKHSQKRYKNEGVDPRWKTTLWDFNIAWGNANYYDGDKTDCWQYELNTKFPYDDCPVPFYWHRMLQDDQFVESLKQRWQEYRNSNHSNKRIMQTVDSLASLIKEGGAADRNEQAWGIYNRTSIWPIPYYASNYDDAVSHLKGWISKRLQFLDRHLLPPRMVQTIPISIASGWNADIVAESLPAASYTNVPIDGADRTFYAETLRGSGGLPREHIINSAHEGAKFELAAYNGLNALSLRNKDAEGTIEFDEPVVTNELFILATSGNGDANVLVRLNYADGTSEEMGTFTIRDWSVRNEALQGDEAVTKLGNIRRADNGYSSDNHYCLFDFSIPVSDRPLLSVTFTSTNYAYASIMALSSLSAEATDIQQGCIDQPSTTQPAAIFDMRGMRLEHLQPGLNIIRTNDGKVRKVIKR